MSKEKCITIKYLNGMYELYKDGEFIIQHRDVNVIFDAYENLEIEETNNETELW